MMFSSKLSSKGFKGSDGKSSDKRPLVRPLCLAHVPAVLSEAESLWFWALLPALAVGVAPV